MAGGMGGMMDAMHRPPAREPFPEMMNSPTLDAAARERLRAAGDERVRDGTAILAEGLDRLAGAAEVEDWAGMQAALARIREGTARMESGIAARRVAAGQADPPAAATDWLKREMNLTPPLDSPTARSGPFGLSWFHFVVMVALIAFAAVMIVMYYRKMHRAADLLRALTGTSAPTAVATTTPAPAPSAAPPPGYPERPTTRWSGRLRVARVFRETPDVKTYRLMNPLGGVLPFDFLPGQFLTLTVVADGKPVRRAYTIASSPTQHDYVEVTVKHEAGGVVSGHLHDRVHEGDLLDCSGPTGSFVFTGRECKCILLIGGGVGITPMMSVVRYLTDRAWAGEIYLIYGVHAPSDIIFREEIEYLQSRHPNFRAVVTVSHPEGTDWAGEKGRITRELIAKSVPDLASRYVHLCGPVSLMEAVKKELAELGVPNERVKTEAFGPALGKPVPAPAAVAPQPAAPAGPAAPAAAVTLPTATFARSHKAAPLPSDKVILDVADELGVEIDNSCRVGTCGLCRVKLLSGTVTMAVEDGLEPGDKEKNIILACQAKAAGDVSVEA
ncbi:MAG: 2Fe-2S iron-sulfur cluster binding domain-containing protein [Gemmataceae bacterium]|nr:2Fe-2S iron-sulfur cluster binding domain-containing protein [Gemmataceae bacterium]